METGPGRRVVAAGYDLSKAGRSAEDGPTQQERVRGVDGSGEDAFAGADQPCVV